MIDVTPYEECVCRKGANTHDLCEAVLTFSEQGKKVKLVLHPGEEAKALVLDGCVFQDDQLKCDGLFLLRTRNKNFAILVELKGAYEISHAFKQLAYVKKSRKEYRDLVKRFQKDGTGQLIEKTFIVSNGMLSKPEHESLENLHGIRVARVLHCEATTPIPDVRQYLLR